MIAFTCEALPGRTIFGAGAIRQLGEEVDRIGSRALVISTPGQMRLSGRNIKKLGKRIAGIFNGAAMHVPRSIADEAIVQAQEGGADCCIALGGGSTIGLAKAIALELSLPILAVPTTYAGSEATPIWGITDQGIKTTGRDLRVLPRTVIYDPELTLNLPPGLSAVSGLNAIAHCVEALYAIDANPVTSLMAEEAIGALAASLPVIVRSPQDAHARATALYGAWLAGTCLGTVTMALHHKLCHTLGGSFGLPHAETHAVMLPHVMAFNAPAAPDAEIRIAQALGAKHAAQGLWELAHRLGAPLTLSELGFSAAQIDQAAALATAKPYPNPRAIHRADIAALLSRAVAGLSPGWHRAATSG